MEKSSYTIAAIGIWHLGEIYSAGLAELGHTVIGIDDNEQTVTNFLKNIPPLSEPQLDELIRKNQSTGRLRYTSDISAVKDCNVVWFTLDTPVDDNDDIDLSSLWSLFERALPHFQKDVLLVVSSQVPVGTSRKFMDMVRAKRPDIRCEYVYTPENLRLGEAVKCFFEPGRIVVGTESEEALQKMKEIFSGIHAEMVRMSSPSAEMAKHALNAFLATSISFINDIADVCEESGADVLEVIKALRSDPRIGEKAALGAGLGFSGGTLGRDLKVLMNFSHANNFVLPVIEAAFQKNRERGEMIAQKVSGLLKEDEKTVAIFGLTYKPGTRTLRRSRALEIANALIKTGIRLRLHDPAVEESELPQLPGTFFSKDPYEAAKGSDALLFITPWPDFKTLDAEKLLAGAKKGIIIIDTANMLSGRKSEFEGLGARYMGIGR